jgi:hypothetical protein
MESYHPIMRSFYALHAKDVYKLQEDITTVTCFTLCIRQMNVAARSRHELSSLARTLGSWVRIPLKVWMSVYAFNLCLYCPVCR